jgi:hypothetical protein
MLHGAMVTGILLFALVAQFLLRPSFANAGEFPSIVVRVLIGVSLLACVVALLLRKRVPPRSTDESADLFWTRATAPALLTWAPLEAASLIAVFVYARTGSQPALAVAAVAVILFVVLNPAYLERR